MDLSLKRGFRETLAATWYKESLEVSGYMEKILKESSCDSTSKTFTCMANGCILTVTVHGRPRLFKDPENILSYTAREHFSYLSKPSKL